MYIKKDYGFTALKNNSWAGAINTLETIEEAGKDDYIYESLGIKNEEDSEEE